MFRYILLIVLATFICMSCGVFQKPIIDASDNTEDTSNNTSGITLQIVSGNNQELVVGTKIQDLVLNILDNEGNGVPGIFVKFKTSTTNMDEEKKVLSESMTISNDDGQVVLEGHIVSHDAGVFIISASIEEFEHTVDFTITMLAATDDTQDDTSTESIVHSGFVVTEMILKGEVLREVTIGEPIEPFIVILKDKDGNLVRHSDNAVFVQFTAEDETGKNIETVLSSNNDDGECHASFTQLSEVSGGYIVNTSLDNKSNIDLYGDQLNESAKALNVKFGVNVFPTPEEDDVMVVDNTPIAFHMDIISGDYQEGFTDAELTENLVVEVRDQFEMRMPGVKVNFSIKGDDGSLLWNTFDTNAEGQAYTVFTLGQRVGEYLISATVEDTSLKVDFLATALERKSGSYEGTGWTAEFTDLSVELLGDGRTKISFTVNLTVTEDQDETLILSTQNIGFEELGTLFSTKGHLNGKELTVFTSGEEPLKAGVELSESFVVVVPRSEVSSIDDVNFLDYFYHVR